MICTHCGGATRVSSTRDPSSVPKGFPRAHRAEADRVIGWYTPEWCYRIRICRVCRKRLHSVEIYVEDVDGMIAEKIADALAKVKG